MFVPSLLLVKETKSRLRDLRSGLRSLVFLPITIGGLVAYVLFAAGPLARIPVLNWSWLGYNIALGPFATTGVLGILPFVPMLVYMLIHVNYFEEMYFRKNVKLVIIWAFLHIAMGVAVYVVFALLPLGFLYQRLYFKRGLNHAYALHFVTNLGVVGMALISFLLPQSS
jgi:membrane protease YdiL (CAAX protease family)